jgi:hypothetical protein
MEDKPYATLITLPTFEEMEKKLLAINTNEYLRKYFYPLLLKYSGNKISLKFGISLFIIEVYKSSHILPTQVWNQLEIDVPKYVLTLIANAKDQEEALKFITSIYIDMKNRLMIHSYYTQFNRLN